MKVGRIRETGIPVGKACCYICERRIVGRKTGILVPENFTTASCKPRIAEQQTGNLKLIIVFVVVVFANDR